MRYERELKHIEELVEICSHEVCTMVNVVRGNEIIMSLLHRAKEDLEEAGHLRRVAQAAYGFAMNPYDNIHSELRQVIFELETIEIDKSTLLNLFGIKANTPMNADHFFKNLLGTCEKAKKVYDLMSEAWENRESIFEASLRVDLNSGYWKVEDGHRNRDSKNYMFLDINEDLVYNYSFENWQLSYSRDWIRPGTDEGAEWEPIRMKYAEMYV